MIVADFLFTVASLVCWLVIPSVACLLACLVGWLNGELISWLAVIIRVVSVLQKHSCDSSPCKNGGTCQELDFTYRCVCREGFLGLSCEVENGTDYDYLALLEVVKSTDCHILLIKHLEVNKQTKKVTICYLYAHNITIGEKKILEKIYYNTACT